MAEIIKQGSEIVPAPARLGAEQLAALDAASDEHAAAMRPANTVRSYTADWKAWQRFAAEASIEETAATRGTLRAFVLWLWESGAAPSTIDRRLTGAVVTLRRDHGVDVNREDVRKARELLKDHVRVAAEQRQPERGRGQAHALTIANLRKMSAACPDTLAGVRDRALIILAFAVAGRRSEIAGINVADIDDVDDGLRVTIRVSKTKTRTVAVPYGSNLLTCPVRTWHAWKTAAGLDDGPAFRRVDRHGRMLGPMSGQAVGDAITRAGERAGIKTKDGDSIRLTGHSVRAGLATEARRAGKDRTAIAATTGHAPSSPVLDQYIRIVDEWSPENNAVIGIGL